MRKEIDQAESVNNIELELKLGQSFIALVESSAGIDRIVVDNNEKTGLVDVRATGHSDFIFDKKSADDESGRCDFLIKNPKERELLVADYLRNKFWGQFNFGELVELTENKDFLIKLDVEIDNIIKNMETSASHRLNGLPEVQKFSRFREKKQSPKR